MLTQVICSWIKEHYFIVIQLTSIHLFLNDLRKLGSLHPAASYKY